MSSIHAPTQGPVGGSQIEFFQIGRRVMSDQLKTSLRQESLDDSVFQPERPAFADPGAPVLAEKYIRSIFGKKVRKSSTS